MKNGMKLIGTYAKRGTAQQVATKRERKHYELTGYNDLFEIRFVGNGYQVWGY